jgi:uncharacterized damage-inducible protein DinB
MNDILQHQFKDLEKSRKDLFNDLRDYSDDVVNDKPSPEAWSIAQVIEHLIMAEEFSLQYLQKKTQDTSKVPVAGFGSQWRFLLTQTVFFMNLKYKAPAIIIPSNNFASIKDLELRWDKVRKETFELLTQLPEGDLKKEIWKHAVAGKMNIEQMLAFFNIHFNRHRKQIYRTLAELVL